MRTEFFWKRLCCCYGAAVGRIARITADTALIIRIGTKLLNGVGGVVYIAKFGGGGICCRLWGATTDAPLEERWLAEILGASGGVVVIGSASLAVGGRRGRTKVYVRPT